MSWHRLHRPTQVSQLHLESVRTTLQQFMERGQLPQVMLFAGPKGTGKTSSARIIGAILNDEANHDLVDYQFFGKKKPKHAQYQEPNQESQFNISIFNGHSFVVQELDAASNRGIDDIRNLKERIVLPPQEGKMTVYILDEAHMLTTAAFNALLKIMEEPPAHVVFILATTELHKIPDTIKSRCTTIHFRKATRDELKAAITDVLKSEKIKPEAEALDMIVNQADGSFRDAVKLLEMVAVGKAVTAAKAQEVLSSSVNQHTEALVQAIVEKDESRVGQIFAELRAESVDEKYFFKSFLNYLHHQLMQNLGLISGEAVINKAVALFLLKEFNQVTFQESPIAHLQLELLSLELISRANNKNTPSGSNSGSSGSDLHRSGQEGQGRHSKPGPKRRHIAATEPAVSAAEPTNNSSLVSPATPKNDDALKKDALPKSGQHGDSRLLIKNWSKLLTAVKEKNMTLEALLRSAKPVKGVNGTAEVAVFYKFHKEQLEQPKFQEMILACAAPIAQGEVELKYVLTTPPQTAELAETKSDQNLAALAEEVLV